MNVFGRGNQFVQHQAESLPSRFGPGWYLMQSEHPGTLGRIFEAQSDGTWLDVTTPAEEAAYNSEVADQAMEDTVGFDRKLAYQLIMLEVFAYDLDGATQPGPILQAMATESGYSEIVIAGDLQANLTNKIKKLGTEYGKIYKTWKDAQ